MLMASNPVNPAMLYLVRVIFEHLMCLETFKEIPDCPLDVAEVNHFLGQNYQRVIRLYNEMIHIETSELRKGMQNESGMITDLHNEFLWFMREFDREMKQFRLQYNEKDKAGTLTDRDIANYDSD